jgi:hypothetical protein
MTAMGVTELKVVFQQYAPSKREKSEKGPFIDLPKRRAGALLPKLIE